MIHRGTQTLHTDRLTLRRFTIDDAQAMYDSWASDPEVTWYLSWEPHPDVDITREVLRTWLERYAEDGYYNWLITMQGEAIGTIAVVRASERDERAEIGYCIGRKHWGQGIMTEALQCVLGFLFDEVGLHRVYLRHDVENIASGRVMIKNGLVREAVLRKHNRRRDDSWGDVAIYGMLREEWQARSAEDR